MGDATIWAGNITTGEVKNKLVNTRKLPHSLAGYTRVGFSLL